MQNGGTQQTLQNDLRWNLQRIHYFPPRRWRILPMKKYLFFLELISTSIGNLQANTLQWTNLLWMIYRNTNSTDWSPCLLNLVQMPTPKTAHASLRVKEMNTQVGTYIDNIVWFSLKEIPMAETVIEPRM